MNDRVKGLTHMYNAAVATGDTKTAEKMQKEYDELADRVNKQTEINRQNAETAEAENANLQNRQRKNRSMQINTKTLRLNRGKMHAYTQQQKNLTG